jgi:hypothetical protein
MRAAHRAAVTVTLAAAALLAGCGSAAPAAPGPAAEAPPGGSAFLATSLVTPAGTWAVAVMGGSVASDNNFWQLFERPAGNPDWKLVTPPGTADNGGLVLASAGRSLVTGFRPSQYLTYTPLTVTRDGGQAWSSASPLDAAVANVPDALAAAPGGGHLLALTAGGTATVAAPGYTSWTTVTTLRSLAATPAGKRCRLQYLTAAAFSLTGQPMLAGACAHPGIAGIFADTGGTWQPSGPPLPAALTGQRVRVLRLTTTASGTAALLEAGAGSGGSLLAVWSAGNGSHWALSEPIHLNGATPISASFGPGNAAAVVLSGDRGETIAGPRASWRSLPALPPRTATLAAGPTGGLDALAVKSTRLTVWQLAPGSLTWAKAQTINVPIQFGSSG